MINYYKADCVYNPREGKNTCSICKYIDECYLVLPPDKEFKHLKNMAEYYYERKKEVLQSRREIRTSLNSKKFENELKKKYIKSKKLYEKIFAVKLVGDNDCEIILVNVPYVKYILACSNNENSYFTDVSSKKIHKNLEELKEDTNLYGSLSYFLGKLNIEIDEVLKKIIIKFNTNQTIHISQLKTHNQLKHIIKVYKPIKPKEKKKQLKKHIKKIEKLIKEYDQQLRVYQRKKFKREKILRKKVKQEIKDGLLI